MAEAAADGGLDGARVLEIGGGIGAIQAELLGSGAAHGEVVELIAEYGPYAEELARERGIAERTSFRVVDVLEEPDAIEPAEVVLLNRVVCCSPDGVRLTAVAARLTRRTLVLSYPREALWVRGALALVNAGLRLLGRSFRVFLHPPAALASAAEAEGLRRTGGERGAVWELAAFRRTA